MGQGMITNTNLIEDHESRITTGINGTIEIDSEGLFYKELNMLIRQIMLTRKPHKFIIKNVYGQRYIGTNLNQIVELDIFGTPGNDLGAFMNGPTIHVYGNAQDGCGNTMDDGKIIIHGTAGDITGLSARGGEIYVEGDVGYRVGIHMKEYEGKRPVLVIGGTTQDFLGEYMAGGILIVLGIGLDADHHHKADFIGTGMHGGTIYLRGQVEDHQLGKEVSQLELDENDMAILKEYVKNFAYYFKYNAEKILSEQFTKLMPVSHRPYGKLYAY